MLRVEADIRAALTADQGSEKGALCGHHFPGTGQGDWLGDQAHRKTSTHLGKED